MKNARGCWFSWIVVLTVSGLLFAKPSPKGRTETLQEKNIGVSVDLSDGSYTVLDPVSGSAILHASIAAEVDHRWLRSRDYAQHSASREKEDSQLASGTKLIVSNTGLSGQPDLLCSFQLHANPDFLTITVTARNSRSKPITVQAFRILDATGSPVINLGSAENMDRVLSDSFSEDRPGIVIHDLLDSEQGMHRAVGSQLIYNRESKRNLFLGTLTSDKFLTVLRLHVDKDHVTSYEADSTGTTELEKENSLQTSPPQDIVELSLPVAPGADLSSEQLLISTGTDYLQQMETYGHLIRDLHHARASAPSVAGWWSWTAYYFGLNQGTALTNAMWLAQNLKDLGFDFFHIDEGYQYARGEDTTPDAALFPDGIGSLESKVRALGLTPGIWTAPFEVSERSSIFEKHKDWLVHNAAGEPIHAGWVIGRKPPLDQLYVLDCTNPEAQDYLRKTYTTLTKQWGIRYIKLDFMDDSAIEGFYYKPDTTALEAQRIGLQVIRQAVGEDVLLDKDGSPMLNPVGLVDTGRISVDTGHTFESSKEAAPGIAARFYMNRNFYIGDPDAFTVSRQTVDEQEWHGGKHPLSLDEAKVSIALAAVAGGMYEIGDDLPTLGADADRMALVKNQDLLNMTRLGHASQPLDLMSYTPEDRMPSMFSLQESKRQSIMTVFNWTDKTTEHDLHFAGHKQVLDVFDPTVPIGENIDHFNVQLPPHSVKVLKIIDTSIPAASPTVSVNIPETAKAGETTEFSAETDPAGVPTFAYHWDFGDGTHLSGRSVSHAYTRAGEFTVKLVADGLDGLPFEHVTSVKVTGKIETRFAPSKKQRPTEQ